MSGELARAVQAGDTVCHGVAPAGAQLQEPAVLLREDGVIDEAALPGRARGHCALAGAGRGVLDAAVTAAAADAYEGDVQWF